MGWKTSTLFIKTEKEISHQQLFRELGIAPVEKIESQALIDVLNPDDDLVYIGNYNGTYIITLQDLPYEFLDEKLSSLEKGLSIMLPDAEIAAIYLHSGSNVWGYSITKNYKRSGPDLEILTPEQPWILENHWKKRKNCFPNPSLQRMVEESIISMKMMKNHMKKIRSERILFSSIASRYLGFPLDSAGSEIEEIYLDGYSLKMPGPVKEPQRKIPEVQFLSKSPVNPLVYLGIGMVLFLMAIVSWILSH
ncbi:MAG: hypothetical protein R2784_03050 [Saprospiraceae bacterium]